MFLSLYSNKKEPLKNKKDKWNLNLLPLVLVVEQMILLATFDPFRFSLELEAAVFVVAVVTLLFWLSFFLPALT